LEKGDVKFVDGAVKVAFVEVFAGINILPEKIVTELGEKIKNGERKILLHIFPHNRYFLFKVGEL